MAAAAEDAPPKEAESSVQAKPKHVLRREERERAARQYEIAALASSSLVIATAIWATWARLTWHLEVDEGIDYVELLTSLLFTMGAAVGMEFYARIAHKSWWHETWMWALPEEWRGEWNESIWNLHKSHHEPREGALEQNDIFAVANAVPAIALILYGFLNEGKGAGMCYGAGLGITIFGIAYMFVHDGLVHRRFPVGPVANVPALKRIAMAHKLHHSEKFAGVPYGLFLAVQELEAVGGLDELENMLIAAELRDQAAKQAEEAGERHFH